MATISLMRIETEERCGNRRQGSKPTSILVSLAARLCSPQRKSEVMSVSAELFLECSLPSSDVSGEAAWNAARFLCRMEATH